MMDKDNSGICKNCNNHIREKLVGLIYHFADCLDKRTTEYLADHLLANGVTVQENALF